MLNQVADKDFLLEVQKKADYFYEKLSEINDIKEISGLGLMIGISLSENKNATEIAKLCIENGLLILTAKTKLRLLPPLNIMYDEIDEGIDIIKKCLIS